MNIANKSLNTMAMDEELESHHAEEEPSEENSLEVSSISFCNESFESASIMQECLTQVCERYEQDCDNVKSEEDREQQISSVLPSVVEGKEGEATEVHDESSSSNSSSEDSDSDEENDCVLSPVAVIRTPISTGKRNSHSKRSASKGTRTYNPQHDFFADCPELNEADGFLQWDDIEPKNCESYRTPVSTVRSGSKIDSDDSFVTPKRITVSAKRSGGRTANKNCKRNLKVTETGEASAGKITNTESLCMLMRGRRVVRDLLMRAENRRRRKCLRQNYGSPVSGDNVVVSPGVPGIHPLPQTPAKARLVEEDKNLLATQPTTPILDAYDKDSNCLDELDPTQPSSMLILQDVIAYVEVRSGGDNRSMGVKDQLQRLGAVVSETFSDDVTHVVFKDGLPSTYNRALRRRIPVVSVLWIEACKKAGLRVSERMYPVMDKNTQTMAKPQKKFRKMKSIQPDYDGKVERKKKKVRKDVCLGAEDDTPNKGKQITVTPKVKSSKLNSIPESPSTTTCFQLFKHCVLTEASTDSDCSPDNLRIPKKKVTKKKTVPPIPKWARKSFSGNPVAETLIGVAKIRRKDFEGIASESPPSVVVQEGPHDSPLALRLLQKISSPAPDVMNPEKDCLDSNNISNETPKRRTDRGVTRKIIAEEKKQAKLLGCACRNVCECSNSTKSSETSNSTIDAQDLRKKDEGSLKRKRNRKVCARSSVRNRSTPRNHCDSLEEASKQNVDRSVASISGDMKTANPKTSSDTSIPEINPGSEKCPNRTRPCLGKSIGGKSSTPNSQAPKKQQSTLDQFFISKEACPVNNKPTGSGALNSPLTNNSRNVTQIQKSAVETTERTSSENLSTEAESSNSTNRNVVDTENQISLPAAPATEFETDEDEFSSSESDLMIPDVEKCIATVTQDLERADSELVLHEPAEMKLEENSAAAKEPVPKRPLKRKLVPTLDTERSEPIVLSGITEVPFQQLMQPRKRRRCSVSEIYGFHLNRLSPKSSSEPDMRNIGTSSREETRLSDDVSLLWKQRKAARKLRTPPLPSLVCTSLHKEDLDLVTAVVKSLGGFNIDNRVGPLTTHVVSGGPRRTLNMLFAIARGLWVLRRDWVLHSLEAGYWLDEEKFEMTDFSPVVMKNRLERQSFGPTYKQDLFRTVGPIFVVTDCSPPKVDLEELVLLCGGKIVTAARSAAVVVGGRTRNNTATCVSAKWVLDSITFGSLQAFVDYSITQAPP